MKKAISFLLTIVMALSIAMVNPATVDAATQYDFSKVTDLGTGKSYTETWTNKHHKEAYYSFTLKKNGYVSLSITKPEIDGLRSDQRVVILDKSKKELWVSNTDKLDGTNSKKTSFKVGLKKGKYYLCIQPLSMTVMSWQSGTTKITLSTKANNYYEKEPNNSKKKANTIKVGKTYKGMYCEEYDSSVFVGSAVGDDWYKVKLKKGKTYKITLKNYKSLKKGSRTTLVDITGGKKKSDTASLGRTLKNKGSVKIKANKTGYYYIRLWNDGQHTGVEYSLKVKKVK
ncbi:MAG: hypothetical protein K6E13_08415 [Lachnospiraceae bacterium]|nr:hypothetical protein [Lachnospiraceae bacterium]